MEGVGSHGRDDSPPFFMKRIDLVRYLERHGV